MPFVAFPTEAAVGFQTIAIPIGLKIQTLVLYVLPPLLFYLVMAFLATIPKTHGLRMALVPFIISLAWRAAFSVDMEITFKNFERKFHNVMALPMLLIATRSVYWAVVRRPLVRQLRPMDGVPSDLADALDLACTLRGHGWDWLHGVSIPHETRPSGRTGFVFYAVLSAAIHALLCDMSHWAIRSFSPIGLGTVPGGTFIDKTLPFHLRYLRASIISFISCITIYSFLQTLYDLCTIVGVALLKQDPTQWPPGFDSPARSTSLIQFWGRRWHQWFRHIFLVQGGIPLSFFMGRAGLILGCFLSSAVFHHIGLNSLAGPSEFWRMLVGFGMMAVGILGEVMFKRWTGKCVCGPVGWIWTVIWLFVWGSLITEGFVRAGAFWPGTLIDGVPPMRVFVECLVMSFDAWLHAM